MAKARIKIARIDDRKKRKVALNKRLKGVKKKAEELSVLCGVETAVVIYSPDKDQPQIWPNEREKVSATLNKYLHETTQAERDQRSETLLTFCEKRIRKKEIKLEKLKRRNEEKDINSILTLLADMKISPNQLSSEHKEKIGNYSRKMQQELAQLYEKKRKERDGGAGSSTAEAPQAPPTFIQQQVLVTRPDGVSTGENMQVPAPWKYQSVHSYQPSPLRPRTPLSVVPMHSAGTVRSVGGGTSQYYPSHCGGLTTSFPVSIQQVLYQPPAAGGRLSLPQSQAYQLRNMSRMPFRMQTRSTLSFTQPQQLGPKSDRLRRPMAPRMGPVLSSQLRPSPSLMGPQLHQQPQQMQPVFLQMQPRMPSQPQTVSNQQPPQVETMAIEKWPQAPQLRIVGGRTSQYYPSQSGSTATSQHQRNQAIYQSHGAGGWLPQPQPQPYQLNNMLMMHSRPPQQLVSMSDRLQPQPPQMDIVSPQLHQFPPHIEPILPQLHPEPPVVEPVTPQLHQSPPQMEAQSPQLAPLPPQLELWSPDQMLFPELHSESPLMEPVSPQLHQSPSQMKPLSPQLDDLPPHVELWSPQMLFPELYPEPSLMDPVSPQLAPLSPELDLWSSQMLPPMALQPETMSSNQPPHAETITNEQQPQAPQWQIGGNNTTVSALNIEGFIPPPDGVNPTNYDDLLEDHEELLNSVAEIMGPDFFGV